jgi:putative acetyltransferase
MELEDGWIHHLYIAPEFQNKGFGTRMLDYAKKISPRGIKLWVFEDNKDAIRLYEREGFLLMKKRNKDETTNEENLPDRLYQWSQDGNGISI